MTLWGTVTALQNVPELETEAVDLSVELGVGTTSSAGKLTGGIQSLYQKCQFYDLLIVGGGSRFPAHQVVLASLSDSFRGRLRQALIESERPQEAEAGPTDSVSTTTPVVTPPEAPLASTQPENQGVQEPPTKRYPELNLPNVTHAEAVPALLDFVYGLGTAYNISSDEANRDVLQLAKEFDLPRLVDLATHRLAQDLTTDNAIGRLVTCEEFELTAMFNMISDELVGNPKALLEVSNNMGLLKHPGLLQKMLVRASTRYASGLDTDEEDNQQPRGKRRRLQVEDKPNIIKGGA